MELEAWKDITGYEGRYQVSSLGNVRSLNYRKTGKPSLLKQFDTGDGYLCVALYTEGKRKERKVHGLVAEAFCENPEPDKYGMVNHKDENKANNKASNLEWCDNVYNVNYGTRNKRLSDSLRKSEKHKANALRQSKSVKCIETGEVFRSTREAERRLGIQRTVISRQCRNLIRAAKGLHFAFV